MHDNNDATDLLKIARRVGSWKRSDNDLEQRTSLNYIVLRGNPSFSFATDVTLSYISGNGGPDLYAIEVMERAQSTFGIGADGVDQKRGDIEWHHPDKEKGPLAQFFQKASKDAGYEVKKEPKRSATVRAKYVS